jgi:hypothetical protein
MMRTNLSVLLVCLFSIWSVTSEVVASEADVNQKWCTQVNGITEFRTKDGTFVDCYTNEYAVEAEYDYNWKEAVGQSLHYAESTGKKAGILFIKRAVSKKNYLAQMKRVIEEFDLPIEIFTTEE